MAKEGAKVTILKGLPCSGKSTLAKRKVLEGGGRVKRVNKDELRAMLDLSKWSPQNERFILKLRDQIIMDCISRGMHIIVDDTNLNPKMERGIRSLVGRDTLVEVILFEIGPDEAWERELKRRETDPSHIHVPRDVIDTMHSKWIGGWREADCTPQEYYSEMVEQDENLDEAIICDIDGTLAHMGDRRGAYEWHKVGLDEPDEGVIRALAAFEYAGYSIILVSGRDGVCRPETIQWLEENGVTYDALFMREPDDMRRDSTVKREIWEQNIKKNWYVRLVLDDRNQTVAEWRAMGFKCFQVQPGNF